jgi:hypothetical protein
MNISKQDLVRIIREELFREDEDKPGAPGSASASDVKNKLLDLAKNVGEIPATQLGAFLAILDEVLELAKMEQLKSKAQAIVKSLDRFDK